MPVTATDRSRATRSEVFAGALAIIVSVAFTVWHHVRPFSTPDSPGYQEVAQDMADGWLHQLHGRTPGYGLVLLLTGSAHEPTQALFITQVVFHLVAVGLIIVMARRFELPGWLLLVLTALLVSPPVMNMVSVVGTEATTELLLVGTAWCCVRWVEDREVRHALSAGVLVALAALTRPAYLVAGLAIAAIAGAVTWRRGRRAAVRSSAAFATGSVLLIGGFVAYNWIQFDYATVTPISAWNLTTKTILFADRLPPSPTRTELLRVREAGRRAHGLSGAQMSAWTAKSTLPEITGLHGADLDQHVLRLDLELIVRNPLEYLRTVGTATRSYVEVDHAPLPDWHRYTITKATRAGQWVAAGVFVGQAVAIGLILGWRRLRDKVRLPPAGLRVWAVAMAFSLYTGLVSVAAETGDPRHRQPSNSLILLATVGGAWMLWTAARTGRRGRTDATKPADPRPAGS